LALKNMLHWFNESNGDPLGECVELCFHMNAKGLTDSCLRGNYGDYAM